MSATGNRFNEETLQVRYKGKTISEVLDMPIDEAADFFEPIPRISRRLRALTEVGLGYIGSGSPPRRCPAGRPSA